MSDLTIEEMQKLIQMEQDERAKLCAAEIQKVLEKHRCKLEPVITITGSGITPGFQIIPLEAVKQ